MAATNVPPRGSTVVGGAVMAAAVVDGEVVGATVVDLGVDLVGVRLAASLTIALVGVRPKQSMATTPAPTIVRGPTRIMEESR